MLRASSQISGTEVDLRAIVDETADSGVPHEKVLLAFADAMAGEDDAELTSARQAIIDDMGPTAMVDAAGIASNFERMVRIADGCGIPLDTPVSMMTEEIRQDLGINDFAAAANNKPMSGIEKFIAKLVRQFMPRIFKWMAKRNRST